MRQRHAHTNRHIGRLRVEVEMRRQIYMGKQIINVFLVYFFFFWLLVFVLFWFFFRYSINQFLFSQSCRIFWFVCSCFVFCFFLLFFLGGCFFYLMFFNSLIYIHNSRRNKFNGESLTPSSSTKIRGTYILFISYSYTQFCLFFFFTIG